VIGGSNLVSGINEDNADLDGLMSAPPAGLGAVTNLTVRRPLLLDSDFDLLPDIWEDRFFGSNLAADPDQDTDGDGLTNLQEYQAGSNPLR
jgi:hypothetical protein